jgi:hypothetical protein
MPVGGPLRLPYKVSAKSEGTINAALRNEGAIKLVIFNPAEAMTIYAGGGNVATIVAYEGNYGYDLIFTLTDVDDNPLNLSGATVKFRMGQKTDTALTIEDDCVLVDETGGICAYTTGTDDFKTPGEYDAELEITYPSPAKVFTVADMVIDVRRVLPKSVLVPPVVTP